MAMRCKDAKVLAFDTDSTAREACSKMARLNVVDERIHVGEFCDKHVLSELCRNSRALIICDCEGYESTLFDDIVKGLRHCDLLIEAHDFIDLNISPSLMRVFRHSHRVGSIFSIDDNIKAQTYDYQELAGLSLYSRHRLLSEHRPCVMRWLHLSPL